MKETSRHSTKSSPAGAEAGIRPGVLGALLLGCVVLGLLGYLLSRPRAHTSGDAEAAAAREGGGGGSGGGSGVMDRERVVGRFSKVRGDGQGGQPAEQVVAEKVASFTRGREVLVQEMAKHFQVNVPENVTQFMSAAATGDWGEIKRLYGTLMATKDAGQGGHDLEVLWPAVRDTYSVLEAAKSWDPKELLAYGQSVLGSLRPNMVYLTASDAARAIPMLLNETSATDRRVVMSQKSLMDATYLDYINFQFGTQLSPLTRDDTQKGLQAYADEMQQRRAAGQVGENVTGGSATLAGVNERMLRTLMEKNPALAFAVEDPSLATTMSDAVVPLGPMIEVRGSGAENLLPARAAESASFWRATAERLQADSALEAESPTRRSYASMAVAQANLFAEKNLPAEAEQAYRSAQQIAPAALEPVSRLSRFLVSQGRRDEAFRVIEEFGRANEGQNYNVEQLRKELTAENPPRR